MRKLAIILCNILIISLFIIDIFTAVGLFLYCTLMGSPFEGVMYMLSILCVTIWGFKIFVLD